MSGELQKLHRPEPSRDRWGRYRLTDPTGKVVSWQRVTTFAKYASDTYNLNKWSQRQTALGLAARPDLLALVASEAEPDSKAGKDRLNRHVADAVEAAKASAGANTGTALHAWTEQVDLGQTPTIPDPWRADIDAYRRKLDSAGVTILPDFIEGVVTLDSLGVAGTFDRIVEIGGRRYIADVKTGKDPAAFPHDICIQLACYATADRLHRPGVDGGDWVAEPMPEVDRERALVIHLPPAAGACTLWWFDIAAGTAMVPISAAVRDWQKRKGTTLATQHTAAVETQAVAVPAEQDRTAWLKERAAEMGQAGRQALVAMWPPHIAKGAGSYTDAEVDELALIIDQIEAQAGQPFGATDPAVLAKREAAEAADAAAETEVPVDRPAPIEEGPDADQAAVDDIRRRFEVSSVSSTVAAWVQEAHTARVPISLRSVPSQRRVAIASGALLAAAAGEGRDDVARIILESILGDSFQTSHTVGQALGALTLDEAREWERLAHAFAVGTAELSFDDNKRPLITVAAA